FGGAPARRGKPAKGSPSWLSGLSVMRSSAGTAGAGEPGAGCSWPAGCRVSGTDSRQPSFVPEGTGVVLPGLGAELGTMAGVGWGPQAGEPACNGTARCGCGNGAGTIDGEPDIGRTACGIGRN